ncbi:hypothetical protein RHGRI_022372 [Rhododendron griersonianum]|uniref:Trehalose-phosphatase n=2 Tax=Rhododendron griersonianum TaxID=479676 RepID=A0AAV6J1C1_9ERIC|nr:hypothetical protein RHGRI_022372 [Rhododendron griersonianum]
MKNQNGAVSDNKSDINMAITVEVAGSSLFTTAAQQAPLAARRYITISRKKLLHSLDIEGGVRLNAWIDSMRASSPTHVKSSPLLPQDQSSWINQHPSALEMFEQITKASKGKQIVMFLDYDGTLSPIVDDPDQAFMSDAMRATVRKLARHFPTAIGTDHQAVLFQPASEFVPMIDEVYKALLEKTKFTPGAKVEHNKFCLSVHFRCVDEKVLEIRPTIKWDKGKALEFLLESLGFANSADIFPIYIGDDRTDEDAFKVLRERGQGFGILVSKIPKETSASYSLQEPSEASYEFFAAIGTMEKEVVATKIQAEKTTSRNEMSLIEETDKMKNQNGAVSDNKSDINMAITVEVAGSSLFTTAAQQAPLAARRYITISRKKLLHSLDIEGGVRLNAWIDSMRASSPTHVKSSPLLPQDQSSWINQHPSALEMFEQITKASKGKQIVMFLDYDGTLSPIVDDPDRAFMSDAMRATVRKLARHFPTAIGTDHQVVLFQPASEFVPMIDEVYKALLEKTKFTPGAKVEHNKFCLSVHFRCVDEKVLEIRPTIKWDKGKALEFLLESLGFANSVDIFPIYIGDDRTDEDAFKVLRERGQGFGILVSKIPKETSASYSLQEPSEASYEFFAAIGTTEKEVVATKIQAEKTTSRNESITSQLKNVRGRDDNLYFLV